MTTRTMPVHFAVDVLSHALSHGIDRDVLLAAAGIPAAALADDQTRLTPEQCGLLTHAAASALDDELLATGRQPVPIGTFTMMCLTVIHTEDLGSALRRTRDFYALFAGMPGMELTCAGDYARFELDAGPISDTPRFLFGIVLFMLHRGASWLIGDRINLRSADFPFPAPPLWREYELIFNCPVTFDANRAAITFHRDVLRAPTVRDEESLHAFLRTAPTDLLSQHDYRTPVADKVRHILRTGLRHRLLTPDDIASRLAMSQRTLRRHLQAEGIALHQIKEELRREAAVTSLETTGESVADLAARLGFSEASAFQRAFKRWTGTTPGAYRRSRSARPASAPHAKETDAPG